MVLATYFRSLAQCVDSGISLQQALGSLETATGMKAELIRVTQSIRDSIARGSTFVEAVSPHPDVFSPLAVGLIEVGEGIGALGDNLRKLADIHERRHRMLQATARRVIYPIALVLVAAYLVPVPILIFSGLGPYLGIAIPRTCFFVLCALIIVFGPGVARATLGRTSTHGFLMKLPLFGTAIKLLGLGRFSRAMGMSISAGVEVGRSMQLALNATDNAIIESRIEGALPVIQRHGLAKGLADARLFDAEAIGVIEIGEQTGHMGRNLQQVADDCDRRAQQILENGGRILAAALLIVVVVVSLLQVFTTMIGLMGEMREGLLDKLN